jgi:beta-glucuronidase
MKLMTKAAAVLTFLAAFSSAGMAASEDAMIQNAYGRNPVFLNGEWSVLIDPYECGESRGVPHGKVAKGKDDFYEYSFDGAMTLKVPGDWNSQKPELEYYEGSVWYQRHFQASPEPGHRLFLYFAGVSYRCDVYLNGTEIVSHEGSFFPFQAEVTGKLKDGDNVLTLRVNNNRTKDAIPAMVFDWWNYGGITRDVMLISLPETFISDYFLRLDPSALGDVLKADVTLDGKAAGKEIRVRIPELGIDSKAVTGEDGTASFSLKPKNLQRWSPENPKLYDVTISSGSDAVSDRIGFKTIETSGEDILLNGKPIFLRQISFHEEIPMRKGRACSPDDAKILLNEAKALGCNSIRLAHYPQNEYIVRMAEEMGFMLWEEIPVWQSIDFTNGETLAKAESMVRTMVGRDRNRAAVSLWGVANETRPSEARNAFVGKLIRDVRAMDQTRLLTAAFNNTVYNSEASRYELPDPLVDSLDVIGINKYLGWYEKWRVSPEESKFMVAPGKPVVISEFGSEALCGNHGPDDVASSWSEEYQEKNIRDQLRAYQNMSNLRGVSPWVLFDFRSPTRLHPVYQDGWNRKGLVSDQGVRKKAWYVVHDFYTGK